MVWSWESRKIRFAGMMESKVIVLPSGDTFVSSLYRYSVADGEEVLVGNGRRLRVLDVVAFDDDELPFVGMLKVETV